MKVSIYTDGSSHPNPGPGGWACVLLLNEKNAGKEICGCCTEETTNNRMELFGILKGLQAIKKPKEVEVTIYSDSQWAINAISNPKWKIKKNLDILHEIQVVIKTFVNKIEFVWLRGHSGDQHNERCDVLSNLARKSKVVEQSQYVRY